VSSTIFVIFLSETKVSLRKILKIASERSERHLTLSANKKSQPKAGFFYWWKRMFEFEL